MRITLRKISSFAYIGLFIAKFIYIIFYPAPLVPAGVREE